MKVWDAAKGQRDSLPQGAHRTMSSAWRSAPTANASSAAVGRNGEGVGRGQARQEVLTLKGHTSGHERGVQPPTANASSAAAWTTR